MPVRPLLVALAAALLAVPSAAQVGATTDIITGRVVGPDGRPVAGARVEATSLETEVTRGKTSNEQGRYTIVFPDGGGQYRVVARAVGFQPRTVNLNRAADEDRLVADFTLSRATQVLSQVNVRAAQPPRDAPERPTPGSTERNLTGDQLLRLPVDGSDPTQLASLAAGVVVNSATDSTAGSFSVAGQRADQNQVTLDGLSFGSGSVPQEAVRNARVITSTYDVARGQFTGGQVAQTTRSGTNVLQGSFGYDLREPELQFTDDETAAFGQRFTQHQLSGGLGGPVAKDRLFWFGSAQWRWRQDGAQTLLDANATILDRFGANSDSVARFLGAMRGFGIPVSAAGVPASDRTSDNLTLLGRADWTLNDYHSVALRGDWRLGAQDGVRFSPLSVPVHGGALTSLGGGVQLTVTSLFDNGVINEFKAYGSVDTRDTEPYIAIPEGRVIVNATLPDGTSGISTLTFGGNPGLPQNTENNQLEATNELSWMNGNGAHRLKLGALLNATAYDQGFAQNRNGTFTFNSLADFEAGRAASFTRTLTSNPRAGANVTGAVYLGDTWRQRRNLQLTYGVRVEGSTPQGTPAYNPLVEEVFGRRTDRLPSDVAVSPRIGFTWTPRTVAAGRGDQPGAPGGGPPEGGPPGGFGGGPPGGFGGGGPGGFGGAMGGGRMAAGFGAGFAAPTLIVRGGIGEFRGRTPAQLFTNALDATGLATGQSQLVCVGPATPVPDWDAYLRDPGQVPTTCADGSVASPTFSTARTNVTVFDPDFAAPRSWRASLGATRRLLDRYTVSADLSYAYGTALYGARDRNLAATPRFTLADEGGRPVFTDPGAIDPASGQVNFLASRRDARFGSVYEVDSRLASHTTQLTLGVNGFTRRGILLGVNYTWARSTDQASGGGTAAGLFASATTVGDPNAREWATSDLERRHVIVGTMTWPVTPSLELTTVARLTSGQPYTPRVAADVNGDGARNDRAFVFDPTTTADAALAAGMRDLLATASDGTRACVEGQLGRLAGRNSCRAPWFTTLDVRLNWRPDRFQLKRNLMVSAQLVNPLAGLDRLLHGSAGVRGWGQPAQVDQNLLYVRGFDAAAQRFVYEVNGRFGDGRTGAGGARQGFAQPFQVALQVRYTVGPDRQRQMMDAMRAAARGGGAAGGGANIGAMLARLAPNPFREVITLRDSLALTPEQVDRLGVERDSLQARYQRLADDAQARIARLGNNVDPQAMVARLREPQEQQRRLAEEALRRLQALLTPDQWTKVPERVKSAQAAFPGAGGGRRPAAARPPGGALD
jgi:hypothetical protein